MFQPFLGRQGSLIPEPSSQVFKGNFSKLPKFKITDYIRNKISFKDNKLVSTKRKLSDYVAFSFFDFILRKETLTSISDFF